MGILARAAGFALAAVLAASAAATGSAAANDDAVIKFGLPQDFTAVYTFVTSEYNQGQRDYLALVNGRGGIGGATFQALVLDHGNQPQRGIEAYERLKQQGALTIDALSTPVSRALVPRAMADHLNLLTTFSGRSDAADGSTFPYVIPMSPMYWSQAAAVVSYMNTATEGGLKGRKLAYVYIDSPFGREPLPVLNALAEENSFELGTFPMPRPAASSRRSGPRSGVSSPTGRSSGAPVSARPWHCVKRCATASPRPAGNRCLAVGIRCRDRGPRTDEGRAEIRGRGQRPRAEDHRRHPVGGGGQGQGRGARGQGRHRLLQHGRRHDGDDGRRRAPGA
ncbi:ABC transporter substrate-binding protein [Tistrella bauzanensis]